MQEAGSGTLWKLRSAAPNFTKLLQLERAASAVVRCCAERAAASLQLCAAWRANECGRLSTGSSRYLTTFSPGASSRLACGSWS
jgi:hypothetical protein